MPFDLLARIWYSRRPDSVTILALAAPAAAPEDQSICVGIVPIAPFGGSNTPGGFFFEVMNAVANKTGLTVTYKPMPFGELLIAVAAGNIDVAASVLAPMPTGREQGA